MKKYAVYKESGIEWLGAIPDHWETSRIKTVSRVNPTKDESIDKASEELVTFLPMECVNVNGTIVTEQKKTIKNLYSGFTFFRKGDIIFAKITPCFENGKGAFLSNLDTSFGFGSTEFHVLRPNEDQCNPEFLYFFTCSQIFRTVGEAFMTGAAGQKRVPSDFVQNFQISLPPIKEQKIIAKYISHKLIRIDSLINKKQQMIELLKEERAAIINQAVTKGINPDAEMKDSGIEWLGEVPKHWIISKLKYLSRIRYGLGQPPKQVEGGLPMIRATNVERGRIVKKDMMFVSSEDVPKEREPFLCENEIIVVRSGAYTADSAIIPKEYEGAVAGYDMVVTPKAIQPKFLSYGLLSQYILNFQLDIQKLRAAQPHLNAEELGATLVLCPPFHEQTIITEYITKRVSEIDKTIELAIKEISLFEEYRIALINEAVTGKIDVRGNL